MYLLVFAGQVSKINFEHLLMCYPLAYVLFSLHKIGCTSQGGEAHSATIIVQYLSEGTLNVT